MQILKPLFFFILLISLISIVIAIPTPTHYYQFENNANDTQNTLNLSNSGAVYSTDSRVGAYSAKFDGIDDKMDGNGLSTTWTNLAVSMWIKTDNITNERREIYHQRSTVPGAHPHNGIKIQGNQLYVGYLLTPGAGSNASIILPINSADLNLTGEWFHVVYIMETGRNFTVWLNNQEYIGPLIHDGLSLFSERFDELNLGSRNGVSNYFNGSVDNILIFEDYGKNMTQADIDKLYYVEPIINNCSDGYGVLNFSFVDELNGSGVPMDYTFTISINTTNGTNTTAMSGNGVYADFCTPFKNVYFNADFSITYSNDDYQQRTFSKTDIALQDTAIASYTPLALSDGYYSRFRTVDIFNSPISGVTVTMSDAGTGDIIQVETSDGSGLTFFWADPDKLYSFKFFKEGYTTLTENIRPFSNEIYIIQLSEAPQEIVSPASGLNLQFYPSQTFLTNNTNYTFGGKLTATYFEFTACQFKLYNDTILLDSTTGIVNASLCNLNVTYFTGNHTNLISQFHYTFNSTEYVRNYYYSVDHFYNADLTLKTFLTDLKNFGEAGFNNASRMMFSFFIILGVTMFMSKKISGFRNHINLLIIIWIMVAVFSYAGFLTTSYPGFPNIGTTTAEYMQQYFLLIMVTLYTGGMFLREAL